MYVGNKIEIFLKVFGIPKLEKAYGLSHNRP